MITIMTNDNLCRSLSRKEYNNNELDARAYNHVIPIHFSLKEEKALV